MLETLFTFIESQLVYMSITLLAFGYLVDSYLVN